MQKVVQRQNEGSHCAASVGQYTIYTHYQQINQYSEYGNQYANYANEYAIFENQYADYASQASASSFDMIAEYVPGSDVTQHSRLDLDQVTS